MAKRPLEDDIDSCNEDDGNVPLSLNQRAEMVELASNGISRVYNVGPEIWRTIVYCLYAYWIESQDRRAYSNAVSGHLALGQVCASSYLAVGRWYHHVGNQLAYVPPPRSDFALPRFERFVDFADLVNVDIDNLRDLHDVKGGVAPLGTCADLAERVVRKRQWFQRVFAHPEDEPISCGFPKSHMNCPFFVVGSSVRDVYAEMLQEIYGNRFDIARIPAHDVDLVTVRSASALSASDYAAHMIYRFLHHAPGRHNRLIHVGAPHAGGKRVIVVDSHATPPTAQSFQFFSADSEDCRRPTYRDAIENMLTKFTIPHCRSALSFSMSRGAPVKTTCGKLVVTPLSIYLMLAGNVILAPRYIYSYTAISNKNTAKARGADIDRMWDIAYRKVDSYIARSPDLVYMARHSHPFNGGITLSRSLNNFWDPSRFSHFEGWNRTGCDDLENLTTNDDVDDMDVVVNYPAAISDVYGFFNIEHALKSYKGDGKDHIIFS